MGLFDFFKKKRQNKYIENLPPAMRKAFEVLFPEGVEDHERQLNELYKHFNNKYKREDIDSNLIFTLTGYLIVGDSDTKESAVQKVLNRKVNTMSKTDIEHLYDFALSNHPKLSSLLTAQSLMDSLSYDGCDTDTILGGRGLFGFSPENPIPTHGVAGIYEYLDHIRDKKGNKIKYNRIGTVDTLISGHPVDVYEITSPIITSPVTLYISAYHKRNSQLSPSDFILVDSNDIVISSGGCEYGIGHRCVPNEAPTPKLVGLTYFGLISSKDLANFPPIIQEAERLNRQGFNKSNDGDIEGAITMLTEAIEKGSINAINSLFTVLHSAERYEEAFSSLENAIHNKHISAALCYNLAVISCGYDTRYSHKWGTQFAGNLLKKAITLPNDGLEEYRMNIQKKAKAFLDLLNIPYDSICAESAEPKSEGPKSSDAKKPTRQIAELPCNIQDIIEDASVALLAAQNGDRTMERDFLFKMFNLVQDSCSQLLQVPVEQCNIVGSAFSLLLSYPQVQSNEELARAIADYAFYCISKAIIADPSNETLRTKRLSILAETSEYFFYTIANAMELPDYNPLDFFASMPLQVRTNSYLYAMVKFDLTYMDSISFDGSLGYLISTATTAMCNDTPEDGKKYIEKIMQYFTDTFKQY